MATQNLLDMFQHVKTAEDEARAREIISAMLGSAAAPVPQVVNNRTPEQQNVAQGLGELLQSFVPQSVDEAQRLLGGAAAPLRGNFRQSVPTATLQQDPVTTSPATPEQLEEEALIKAVTAEQDSRLAALMDVAPPGTYGHQVLDSTKKQGDIAGGVERVNRNTATHGIIARRLADGSVELTNIDPATGKATPQSQPAPTAAEAASQRFAPMADEARGRIQTLVQNVRTAPTVEEAQAQASSLRESLAVERTRMEADAYTMAASELGVHKLQKALDAQQSMDAAVSGWRASMGDSPQTAMLRGQLMQAETAAQKRAEQWLSRNISYAQLGAAEKDAAEAVNLAVQKAASLEQRRTLADAQREARAADKAEQVSVQAAGIPSAWRMKALELEPGLEVAGDQKRTDANLVSFFNRAKNDKQLAAILDAEPTSYPLLAIQGNARAEDLAVLKEVQATGLSEEQVRAELKLAKDSRVDAKSYGQWATQRIREQGGSLSPDEQKNLAGEWTKLSMATGKEGAARKAEMESAVRLSSIREKRTQTLMNDVLSWATPESPLYEAAKKAAETTGKAPLSATLATLVRQKPIPEQVAIMRDVRDSVLRAASRYDGSLLGAPDKKLLEQQFNQTIQEVGSLSDMWRVNIERYSPLGTGLGMQIGRQLSDPTLYQQLGQGFRNLLP